MKKLFTKLNNNGLFIKMFIVMLLSIVTISIAITYSTIRMSEKLFMETFSITSSKVINQMKNSFESFSYSIVTAVNNISSSMTVKDYLTQSDSDSLSMSRSYYQMGEQMSRIKSHLDAYDVGINLLGVNERSFSTNTAIWSMPIGELVSHVITMKSYDQPDKLTYHYDYPNEMNGYSGTPTIIASKALTERTSGYIYGVLYFAMEESKFKQFYTNYTSDGNDIIILDNTGLMISSNRDEWIGKKDKKLLNYARNIAESGIDYKNADVMERNQIILSEYLPSFDLYIVNLVDRKLVMKNLIDTKAIVFISISIVSIALFIVFLISRRLTKSLTDLVKQISSMPKYEFDQYVTASGSYETMQLANTFNSMLDELHEYVEELMETQKKQRKAELAALQQQINPHFLYNTLASIKIMVEQGNKENAAKTIHALISLLQNTVGNISETISVEQELINMKNYAFINQMRYGQRIKVNYYVSPDCLTFQLPKLIIQPFIENAFFHAFNKKSDGFIHIMVAQEGEQLICEIVDNGDGMHVNRERGLPSYKSTRQLFSGIGVNNVNDRIKLLYGEAYGVEIRSRINEGTRVKIRLPLILPKESRIN
ncbi:sensor histidine kinase [Lederbergia lenta]|uniref:sensor histidine kinase n=1 Tax=Lederbergia lenta TaxID=1467 RepID=UPI00203AE651|nr:sensor histidine kinase [Lederbergia lenta]MCM3110996.1 sensor histidine kinase [Lederbergia lenta]